MAWLAPQLLPLHDHWQGDVREGKGVLLPNVSMQAGGEEGKL